MKKEHIEAYLEQPNHSLNAIGISEFKQLCDLALLAVARSDWVSGWQPIETAPKDGKMIIAWCVHETAKYSKDPIGEGWEAAVITRWIDHNGGGWTWHGHAGTFTHWLPLPPAPKEGV